MKKRIVVCADGTWNRPERDPEKDVPTNVLRLARAIKPVGTDGVPQQVFYDWGIGSYHDKVVAGATGKGLHKNIMDGYRYIVQNYSAGDELFLFGFSRGAYTIRSLCGMINNCGIVKRPDAALIQRAFDQYKRSGKTNKPTGKNSVKFRDGCSYRSRKVKFVGVWDTVGAMGIPLPFLGIFEDKDEFYDTELGSNVEIARHAMAIDEVRRDFEPTIWVPKAGIDIKQVWFSGAHSNVGGGYPPDRGGALASDIPLKWLLGQAEAAGLSLEPHLNDRLHGSSAATLHQPRRHFYRLKKKFHRDLDHGKGPVCFHQSVKERWDRDAAYRRKSTSLRRYLKANGWPAVLEP